MHKENNLVKSEKLYFKIVFYGGGELPKGTNCWFVFEY